MASPIVVVNPEEFKPELLVVDGSNRASVAYFGSEGSVPDAFWKDLQIASRYLGNPMMIVVWDIPGGSKSRRDLYPPYKLNRTDDPQRAKAVVDCMGFIYGKICTAASADVEADDVIAAIVKYAGDLRTVIYSNDGDLHSLLRPGQVAQLLKCHLDDVRWMTAESVSDKFGVSYTQFEDYRVLIGDSSDNLPGVNGIGPKSAADVLRFAGTLDSAITQIDKLPLSKSRKEKLSLAVQYDEITLMRKLAHLRDDTPLDTYVKDAIDGVRANRNRSGFQVVEW